MVNMKVGDSVICMVVCSNYTVDEEIESYGQYHGQVGKLLDISYSFPRLNKQPYFVKFKNGTHLWCSEVAMIDRYDLPKELFEI